MLKYYIKPSLTLPPLQSTPSVLPFLLLFLIFTPPSPPHCDLKVSSSQAKFNENFANYFLKTKVNNKCSIVLKYNILRPTENRKWVRAVKSKPKALTHFKVDPVLKIDETFYKQAESMWAQLSCLVGFSLEAYFFFLCSN